MARRPDVFRRTEDGGITIKVWRGLSFQRARRLPLASEAEAEDIMRQLARLLRQRRETGSRERLAPHP